MFKYFVWPVVLGAASLFFAGCSDANNKPLSIAFSADSSKIVFSHIDPRGLLELKALKNRDSVLMDLVSVLQTPSEKDSVIREEAIPGTINLTDSNLVFSPIQPFVKGREYLVITHLNIQFAKPEEIIKGKLSYTIKPQQKVLNR
ncbi:hypothetical protein [Pedobacter polysacchareus]|uniref:hypothetical protein n=1 Tax=Pedobacter polysacchareus TaxID=2861973 RepID=UPI001C9964EE|nr:hypothetical protein [Pedobacter polysacchareus]